MAARFPFGSSSLRSAGLLSGAIVLAFAAAHCGRDEKSVPVGNDFGNGGRSSSGGVKFEAGVGNGGGSSGDPGPGPGDDPNFDPTADGGYWSGYDAGEDNFLEDGGLNGGPQVYASYSGCQDLKVSSFVSEIVQDGTATYGADFTPAVEGTLGRINLIMAASEPISYLGPFFPLGFIDPNPFPPGLPPKVATFPFFKCKRCFFVPIDDQNAFVAVGGMLLYAPSPDARSGKINARVDLAVLVESRKGPGDIFFPVQNARCLRVRSASIVVR